ncbi:hypothetical protein CBL_00205 [Carabus blaptoides fortunei]
MKAHCQDMTTPTRQLAKRGLDSTQISFLAPPLTYTQSHKDGHGTDSELIRDKKRRSRVAGPSLGDISSWCASIISQCMYVCVLLVLPGSSVQSGSNGSERFLSVKEKAKRRARISQRNRRTDERKLISL